MDSDAPVSLYTLEGGGVVGWPSDRGGQGKKDVAAA